MGSAGREKLPCAHRARSAPRRRDGVPALGSPTLPAGPPAQPSLPVKSGSISVEKEGQEPALGALNTGVSVLPTVSGAARGTAVLFYLQTAHRCAAFGGERRCLRRGRCLPWAEQGVNFGCCARQLWTAVPHAAVGAAPHRGCCLLGRLLGDKSPRAVSCASVPLPHGSPGCSVLPLRAVSPAGQTSAGEG